jgi:hypothetical protein
MSLANGKKPIGAQQCPCLRTMLDLPSKSAAATCSALHSGPSMYDLKNLMWLYKARKRDLRSSAVRPDYRSSIELACKLQHAHIRVMGVHLSMR